MKHVLLFNLATDADDPILGFTTGWIAILARHVATIDVITMRAGRLNLPPNVRVWSVGKERGYSEPRRAARFYQLLVHVLHTTPIDACFSHMMPLFSVLGGPLLRAWRIPLVTWYAHPHISTTLKLAHHISNRMVASVEQAYPYHHHKLSVIGQGIDTDLFSPDGTAPDDPPLVLCAGRLSPVKDHATLLRAVATLKQRGTIPFKVAIVGQPAGAHADAYVASLRHQIAALDLAQMVRLEPGVPAGDLVAYYRRCRVHVNLTPTGFGDKVAWEAMSCGRVSLAANEGFRATMGQHANDLLFAHGDQDVLAERLAWALALRATERDSIGSALRAQVLHLHSLEGLPHRLGAVFAALEQGKRQQAEHTNKQ